MHHAFFHGEVVLFLAALSTGVLYHKPQVFKVLVWRSMGPVSTWWKKFGRLFRSDDPAPEQQERTLNAWYHSALGRSLHAAERAVVDTALNHAYHPFVVQLDVGLHEPLFDPEELKCKSTLMLSRCSDLPSWPSACADLEYLPLQPDTVDCLIVHHALDFVSNPHRVLRESVQALRPGGHLILVGFNPYGFWGWSRLWRWSRKRRPWEGRFLSLPRLVDWCELLDCGEIERTYCYHWPPLAHAGWKRRARRLNLFIRRYLPVLGGSYVLVVRKNQLELLNNSSWQPAIFFKGQVVGRDRGHAVNRWKS